MNKLLFETSDEFNLFRLYELDNEYTGVLTEYYKVDVIATNTYFYSKTNIPEPLLILLIEANEHLTHEQDKLLWSLIDYEP